MAHVYSSAYLTCSARLERLAFVLILCLTVLASATQQQKEGDYEDLHYTSSYNADEAPYPTSQHDHYHPQQIAFEDHDYNQADVDWVARSFEYEHEAGALERHETSVEDVDVIEDSLGQTAAGHTSEALDHGNPDAAAAQQAMNHTLVAMNTAAAARLTNRLQNLTNQLMRAPLHTESCREAVAGLQQLAARLETPPTMRKRMHISPPSTPDDYDDDSGIDYDDDSDADYDGGAEGSNSMQATDEELDVVTNQVAMSVGAQALFQLAALRSSGVLGQELPHSTAQVVVALHRAAAAGSLEAQLALAHRFLQGHGVEKSCPVGLGYAKQAAERIAALVEKEQRYAPYIPPVMMRERWMNGAYVAAEEAENGAHVIQMEEDMALRGNVDAQRRMAYRRLVGRGLEADPEAAYHDLVGAAAQGDMYAIFNIGYMYLRGLHVAQNFTAARDLFEAAAEKGLAAGYNGLGVLYWTGFGDTPQNLTAAFEAFEKGAALNNPDSLYNLATMYLAGIACDKNETRALELLERADKEGHWRAPLMLDSLLESGLGTQPDCDKAYAMYRRFFTQRHTWADDMSAAAKALDSGHTWRALVRYVLLAEQGSEEAAANAGWMLVRGAGAFDEEERAVLAARMFLRSAAAGSPSSIVELAHLLCKHPSLITRIPPGAFPSTPPPNTSTTTTNNNNSTDTHSADTAAHASSTHDRESTMSDKQPAPHAPTAVAAAEVASAAAHADVVHKALHTSDSPALEAVIHAAQLRAFALYMLAAHSGDVEGLYYVADAHHRGVGTPVNLTLARALYTKALLHAGQRSPKALAPALALLGMHADWLLQPLAGPYATLRLLTWLRRHADSLLLTVKDFFPSYATSYATSSGTPSTASSHSSVGDMEQAAAAGHTRRAMFSLRRVAGFTKLATFRAMLVQFVVGGSAGTGRLLSVENIALSVLIASLVAVMLLRKRHVRVR